MNMELNDLLAIKTLTGHPEELQIDIIGSIFDLSFDESNLKGIAHGFELAKQLEEKNIKPTSLTVLYYDLANGWGYQRKLKYSDKKESWLFNLEETTKEIFYLRKAVTSPGFLEIEDMRRCQIWTNLANIFSFVGRFVEAQEYWNKALEIDKNFAMAIGNMANGMYHYGRILYDDVHGHLFTVYSYHHFKRAVKLKHTLHQDAAKGFQELHDWLENLVKGNFPKTYHDTYPELDNYDLGENPELVAYRLWCLENKLYVNPLNDLGPHKTGCHDCLNLPTLILPANRPPVAINLFNQIKQEFATARYSFYRSENYAGQHLSDFDVPLVDTMEMLDYSYHTEQLKTSFRLAYSILDKIAYLLNDYLELGIPANKVSFRTLWFTDKKRLRPFFETSENWSLRGLFWVAQDLYEKDDEFGTVLEPEAREVALIRNYIEHKGFKITSDFTPFFPTFTEADVSYAIKRTDFTKKTLRLLKLARAAMMYTAFAISHEEKKKDFGDKKSYSVDSALIPGYRRT
jgi:tetratricopeptide (TPR) repeat protein